METDKMSDGPISAKPSSAPTSTPASRIGQRLRRARLLQNLTQGELAKGAFSVSYVSALERGQIRPSLGALERLASRLQVPLSDFLTDAHDTEIDAGMPAAASLGAESEHVREEIAATLRDARVSLYQGNFDAAISTARAALEHARLPRDRASAHFHLAECYLAQHSPDQARDELLESMTLAERVGDHELVEHCRNALGAAYLQQGKPLLALECHRLCYDAAQRGDVRDPAFQLSVTASLADEYWLLGDNRKALQLFEQAARLSSDMASPERLGHIYWRLATEYMNRRDPAHAMRYAVRSLHSYDMVASHHDAASAQSRLGRVYVWMDQLDQAAAHLRAGHATARALGDARATWEAASGLSTLHLRRRQLDEAEAMAREALEAAGSRPYERADALLALGEALDARGAHAEADAPLREALHLLEASGSRHRLADAYVRLSTIYEHRGEAARALAYLKQAWQTSGYNREK